RTPATAAAYTCYALRRVDVPKGTPGAYAYTRSAQRTGPAGGLTPVGLAKAYDLDPGRDRRGQTVALVNWYDDPKALADLNRFDRHYGLKTETSRSFRKVNQSGKARDYPRASRASARETALDIETTRAVCRTCRILLVEANGPGDTQLAAAENTAARLGATEISNSFGTLEHHVSAEVRDAFDHPGVVITAATGDAGWYGWDAVNDDHRSAGRASFPATDPHVVAVGATTLNLHANGTRASETVWNGNGADDAQGIRKGSLGASGGGCSKIFTAASWQRRHAGYAATKCDGKRLAADISADGDPQTGFDVVDSDTASGAANWTTYGGTSLSSPLVAAMFALAGGAHGSAYPAASLYVNATHSPYRLYDVTAGGNSFCGGDTSKACGAATRADTVNGYTNNPNAFGLGVTDCTFTRDSSVRTAAYKAPRPECNATTGYDGPSGLGTPRRPSLFSPTNPKVTVHHPAHTAAGHRAFVTAKAVERVHGLHPVRYSWSFGDGKSSSGSKPGVHHTWTKPGSYPLTLRVTDSSGQITIARVHQTVH
ncbi:PKD domain-containing protein, partial [Jatrophihabitans endophyticus]|uniref:PKD domain-containing protein n=1 Tax=Jatrophihabitans endophyticus TaxID=1206085 RepID=UPI0019F71584